MAAAACGIRQQAKKIHMNTNLTLDAGLYIYLLAMALFVADCILHENMAN